MAGGLRAPGAFEETLWRALAILRLATLAYAAAVVVGTFGRYERPGAAWPVLAVMAAWSGLTIAAYARPRWRSWPVLAADLAVTAGCLLSSRWVVGAGRLAEGAGTLPLTWMACPVLAVAVARGRRWGAAAALGMGAVDLTVRGGPELARITGTVVMVVAAVVVAHLARLAAQVQQQLRRAAEAQAATRERERLARGIHDSVLQVLALVQRRGAELGGEAAELGRLAGEQEAALRSLVAADPVGRARGLTDLRAAVRQHATGAVTVAAPAQPVWLPARVATELAAAAGAALDNVARHAGDGAQAWVLIEDEGDAVRVTVRDDGPGVPPGRLEQAAADGRLGVAQAIVGRVRELGGEAAVTCRPGEGTEVELRVPRPTG